MRIESGQQMFQHIENGGNLKLNREGQLETQSAAGRFFQKIGDAFRSLTASGRAAIETRNARLHEAMADMVRRDALVNPAQTEIPNPMTDRAQRSEFAMRLELAQGLSKLPKESRAAARNLALHVLHSKGMPENGDPASVGGETRAIMRHIEQHPGLRDGLRCDYARTNAQLQPLLREMTADLRAEYAHQKARHINEDGMHDSYVKDAKRGSVRSINGHAPDAADFEGEFKALIPDEKMRGFLSMMASQAGVEGSLAKQLMMPDLAKDNPDFPGFQEMVQNGLLLEFPHHKYDISVEGGQARIRLEMDAVVKGHQFDGELVAEKPVSLGGGRYSLEMVVDLNQDMTGKDIPDFTLVNASREPLNIDAPDFTNATSSRPLGASADEVSTSNNNVSDADSMDASARDASVSNNNVAESNVAGSDADRVSGPRPDPNAVNGVPNSDKNSPDAAGNVSAPDENAGDVSVADKNAGPVSDMVNGVPNSDKDSPDAAGDVSASGKNAGRVSESASGEGTRVSEPAAGRNSPDAVGE